MLLAVLDSDLVAADTVTDGHGEVGDGSEGSDERSQDVEHAFLLRLGRKHERQLGAGERPLEWWKTYDWDTESHGVERNGGDDHNDEDNPLRLLLATAACGIQTAE